MTCILNDDSPLQLGRDIFTGLVLRGSVHKGCTGYLGHPFLHQEHRGVHEEQGRGFSCREGCFSRLFPVADSAKQEARLPTDLVPRACVRHSLLPCEQGKRKKTCPRPDRSLGHDRGTERNRRASDYPQEDQRDKQTRSTTFFASHITISFFSPPLRSFSWRC